MFESIIRYSIHHKLIILLFTFGLVGYGTYAIMNIPIGAVPDITNNQVQVITTSRNLATEDIEKFVTAPVELEMANLPGVKEIRSISKFGLSVVTIVFEDNIGTYLPRQLIAEKIKSAEEKIPTGFGTPFMGPVSTGLGEIYQYILDVKPGYEGDYSTTDLRTIQDWIVKRQLSGIPGVVEVNTWGGYLKTYEVSINPSTLRSMEISLDEVYEAMQLNNSVAGGGYIEKTHEAYFIRADGLVKSIEDIKKIVVKSINGKPIYIKDLAEVGFGHATRFGAITGNGQGEKVLGQVMMLKGAASKKVIDDVKERVSEIQTALPEGVFINPFLERSELIGKTTFTISENLLLGCLIVIFVVILLLGNFRSGLVVASVIPLCLLFAISLMYIFGVDANLMSLGAIDFGIIIDGAVIIVEYVSFKITSQASSLSLLSPTEKKKKLNDITFFGTNKMMHSAIFGQLIIIIVFIPILSLSGVEGKMFGPMAKTFCFAIIGAMILCFTYVPVMSSLFIKPSSTSDNNISARFIKFLQRLYVPSITFALKHKAIVLSFAVASLLGAFVLFSNMGGEFVPTLDEGDFVIQPVLKTGMSLEETIKMTTRMEKIIKRFPEVNQVVSRIGAAEVPTDPMSMEESDIIITLFPKSSWKTAKTKDGLAEVLKEALLNEIPGVEIEFTQPIEMRFNELITGVRADLAIKLFGEDLEILNKKGQEIKSAIANIAGAADITIEKTAGLPQMTVNYDRAKMARYGVNVSQLNQIISMGFAGLTAGNIFEGEKQFDLVVKYDKDHREDIQDLKASLVTLSNGQQIPLETFADIRNTTGPAKISRDDTKRRVVIGVNVRGRDLQSVVDDVKHIIDSEVQLPPGYVVDYGGQFENLQSATSRLMVAVPISLILIFILLYFAFNSIKDALIIFSAIPLASVGGILFLYMRDMPFSISAGVGFIALFGIAVLNGIVLIEHFKELKAQGMTDTHERIIKGATERLRPVLLTALAAALGFLPMAISTSAGAEVQKPLATVVIGGLISSTLLTLLVLPALYAIFDRKPKKRLSKAYFITLLFMVSLSTIGESQQQLTLDNILTIAVENNYILKNADIDIQRNEILMGTAKAIPMTNVYYSHDRNNIAEDGNPLHVIGVTQAFNLPNVYKARKGVLASKVDISKAAREVDLHSMSYEITKEYFTLLYYQDLMEEYLMMDSLYQMVVSKSYRKFQLGESNNLEKISLSTKRQQLRSELDKTSKAKDISYGKLKLWMQTDNDFELIRSIESNTTLPELEGHPMLAYYENLRTSNIMQQKLDSKSRSPEISISLFGGVSSFSDSKLYPGIEFGIGVPLWSKHLKSNIKASALSVTMAENDLARQRKVLQNLEDQLQLELEVYDKALAEYRTIEKDNYATIINSAQILFNNGEIDYFEYIQAMDAASSIKSRYLQNEYAKNITSTKLKYLINQ